MKSSLCHSAGVLFAHHFDNAEIGDLQFAFVVEQHIGRFDVAMNDACVANIGFVNVGIVVSVIQSGQRLFAEVNCLRRSRHALPGQQIAQAHPRHILHHQVIVVFGGKEFVNANYVRMIELGLDVGFATKPRLQMRLGRSRISAEQN